MKRISLNIQTIVAAVFTLLFVTATFTTLFGQEQNEGAKKERTKIITLKITEDENGRVKTIDTTMIFEGDELKVNGSDEEIMIWMDNAHNMHKLYSHDSLMFVKEYNVMKCDSMMKIMVTVDAEDEDVLIDIVEDGEKYFYKYNIDSDIDGDSIHMIIKTNVSSEGKGEKTVTVSTTTEAGGSDLEKIITKEITVEVDGDNVNIWTTDEGESYKVVTKTITLELLDPEKKELKDLKKAGVDTKNRELEIDDLRFSPNPSDGKINLSFTLEEKKTVTINIYDINGNIVYTETIRDFQGTYNKEIDISDKGTGAFFLQIIQGLYDVIKKIIIQ